MTVKNDRFEKENILFDNLKGLVKLFAKEGVCFDSFMGYVKSAILEAIVDGCMFEDYLSRRDEIEDPDFMPYDEDEWDDLLIRAMGKNSEEYMESAYGSENDSLWKKLGLEPKKIELGPEVDEAIYKALGGD